MDDNGSKVCPSSDIVLAHGELRQSLNIPFLTWPMLLGVTDTAHRSRGRPCLLSDFVVRMQRGVSGNPDLKFVSLVVDVKRDKWATPELSKLAAADIGMKPHDPIGVRYAAQDDGAELGGTSFALRPNCRRVPA